MAFITNTPSLRCAGVNTSSFTPPSKCNLYRAAHGRLVSNRVLKYVKRVQMNVQVAGAGMRIIRQADEATIEKLGCRSWGTWGCEPSTFPWTYSSNEVCLILEGNFTVVPDDGSEAMDVKAGDIAYFPAGMSCTWNVRSQVNKHFKFGIKI